MIERTVTSGFTWDYENERLNSACSDEAATKVGPLKNKANQSQSFDDSTTLTAGLVRLFRHFDKSQCRLRSRQVRSPKVAQSLP